MNRKLNHALASLVLMYSATAWSQEATMATINGQDEYQLSGRTECGGEATSTIKPGERFIARELSHGDGTGRCHLKSGISGNIPRNRIRVLPDEPLAKLNYGLAGEEDEWNTWVLLHVAGDDTFAKLLAGQSSKVREGYAAWFPRFATYLFSNPKPYIKLHFPKTYAILYGR
jgi:hypothetical protein